MALKQKCKLTFYQIKSGLDDTFATLTLTRPEVSNALDPEMIDQLISCLDQLEAMPSCRVLILRAEGKNFCAGGDLERMYASIKLSKRENWREAEAFHTLFEKLSLVPQPTIALVQGFVYGGGVGLVASCDWAIAANTSRFCLSEMRLGLVAAPIIEVLSSKLRPGDLRRLVLTGRVFGATDAQQFGLVQSVGENLDPLLREELSGVLKGAPTAQRKFKTLHKEVLNHSAIRKKMIDLLAQARISAEGQAGMRGFLEKKPADWIIQLPADWRLPELDD
jgi:methylglutaconyl-CoA hydratase